MLDSADINEHINKTSFFLSVLIPFLWFPGGCLADLFPPNKVLPVVAATAAPQCYKTLSQFPGNYDHKQLEEACSKVETIKGCRSVKGEPIFHLERPSVNAHSKRVLVFSMIHGDELPAGTVGRYWLLRLQTIDPRNHWRVIPLLNPDGFAMKTRTNANRVDLNRNFPTKDWEKTSTTHWKQAQKSNPRRFPGEHAASEPEVQCALNHIEDFRPDFIVSIHTPLHVLDFDGPPIKPPPQYKYLPWRNLGHFPGSLGRYMWFERNTPVLTMELGNQLPSSTKPLDELQDILGLIASVATLTPGNKIR